MEREVDTEHNRVKLQEPWRRTGPAVDGVYVGREFGVGLAVSEAFGLT